MKIDGLVYKNGWSGLGYPLMDEIVIAVGKGEDIYVEDKNTYDKNGLSLRYVKVGRKEDKFTERAQKRSDDHYENTMTSLFGCKEEKTVLNCSEEEFNKFIGMTRYETLVQISKMIWRDAHKLKVERDLLRNSVESLKTHPSLELNKEIERLKDQSNRLCNENARLIVKNRKLEERMENALECLEEGK